MKTKSGFGIVLSLLLYTAIVFSGNTQSTSFKKETTFHSPAEMYKIMEDSKITYVLGDLDKEIPYTIDSSFVLSNQLYVENRDGDLVWSEYSLDDSSIEKLNQAETLFQDKNYILSKALFRQVFEDNPSYSYALTMIADVFFMQAIYDSAEYYFKKAIEMNPIDYIAHWFLADTFWNKGDSEKTIDYITRAHLLNRNHQVLKKMMIYYYKQADLGWDDWVFNPQYKVYKEDKQVKVFFNDEWMAYALTKALWKFEPGYAESVLNTVDNNLMFIREEEAEAIVSQLMMEQDMQPVKQIVDDGYFDEFWFYEIVTPQEPRAVLEQPREVLDRVVKYIKLYHRKIGE